MTSLRDPAESVTANLHVAFPAELVEAIAQRAADLVVARRLDETKPPASAYMSIAEAAEYLRCSRQRVDDLLSQRRLTRFKEGRRTLVSRAEIEHYVRPETAATSLPPPRDSQS